MKPSDGKILIVEDNALFGRVLEGELNNNGFETVRVTTMDDALALLPTLGEMGVGGALLDGNISSGSRLNEEGTELNRRIKALYGDTVRTAGIASSDIVDGADIPDLGKDFLADIPGIMDKL